MNDSGSHWINFKYSWSIRYMNDSIPWLYVIMNQTADLCTCPLKRKGDKFKLLEGKWRKRLWLFITFAISLCKGFNPSNLHYSQDLLKEHRLNCIEEKYITKQ